MLGAGKSERRRASSWLMLVLCGLGLAGLALPETATGELTTAWVRRYQALTNGSATARLLAMDGQGNVYVTWSGYIPSGFSTTIKYSPDGEEMWARQFCGPGTGDGEARAMAVDSQGNVYITGSLTVYHGLYSNRDYATTKFSADGRQLWVRYYNGPANGDDAAKALAVDSQGNVYVAGDSKGGESGWNCLTIKYDPDGRLLWARRYRDQNGGVNYAAAIVVDAQGHAYVAGTGYTVIKYNPEGRPLWVRQYQGGTATALAVDGQGNICVTGSTSVGQNSSGYTTVKYSPDGRRLWVRRSRLPSPYPVNQAQAIAVDSQDNVLVTGNSWNPNGPSYGYFATIKYSPDGRQLWRRIFQPYPNYQTKGTAAEGQGDVQVPGNDRAATGAYDPDGQRSWWPESQELAGLDYYPYESYLCTMVLDNQGNVYIARGGFLKYSSDGRWLWLQYLNEPSGIVSANSVVVDNQGNVYGTGGNLAIKYTQTP